MKNITGFLLGLSLAINVYVRFYHIKDDAQLTVNTVAICFVIFWFAYCIKKEMEK